MQVLNFYPHYCWDLKQNLTLSFPPPPMHNQEKVFTYLWWTLLLEWEMFQCKCYYKVQFTAQKEAILIEIFHLIKIDFKIAWSIVS